MTRSSLALLLLLASPAAAARRTEVPPAADLLALALSPATAYRAKGRVQQYPASGKPRSQTVSVAAAPGGRYHMEYAASARKAAALILNSDGKTRSLLHVRPGALWTGPVTGDPAGDAAVFRDVYVLSSSTGGVVAKRSTWRLDFREKAGGALRRSWWLDRKTGVVLRREQYRPDGSLSRRERFSRFEPGEPGQDAFAPLKGLARPWTEPGGLAWRPEGFVPLETRRDGEKRVFGYGDGHRSMTLVVSPRQPGLGLSHGVGKLPDGDGVRWRCGKHDCRLVGDVLEDEMRLAAASVEALP